MSDLEGYDEAPLRERFRRGEVPMISRDFMNVLRSQGVAERDFGYYAAEMEAANEGSGGVNSFQTYCNVLEYPESMLRSQHADEASKQAQEWAERELNRVLEGTGKELDYDARVDLLMERLHANRELEGLVPFPERLPFESAIDLAKLAFSLNKEGRSEKEIKERVQKELASQIRRSIKEFVEERVPAAD